MVCAVACILRGVWYTTIWDPPHVNDLVLGRPNTDSRLHCERSWGSGFLLVRVFWAYKHGGWSLTIWEFTLFTISQKEASEVRPHCDVSICMLPKVQLVEHESPSPSHYTQRLGNICTSATQPSALDTQVVLKPSELTPLTAVALAELAERAGVPDGVFNLVMGDAPAIGVWE